MFRDQVDVVSSWFSRWNECEQTVALYSLLRKVSGVQAKFLLQVIQQSLTSSPDVIPLERQANDPGEYPMVLWGNVTFSLLYVSIPKCLVHVF